MNPYRSSAERADDLAASPPPATPPLTWAHGELTIAGMLIVVGGIGVALGAFGASEGRELPIGLLLLVLGAKILVQEWRSGGE
jgi:hypothetical protein